jgi:ribonuclease Y
MGGALLVGGILGYFLRFIVSLGKKGSMELEIKKMMLDAKEEAERITEDAKKKAEDTVNEKTAEFKERERDLKKTEERLIRKEELLDKRQTDIDTEEEQLHETEKHVDELKQKAAALVSENEKALQRVSGLSVEDAKTELLKTVAKEHEEDMNIRMAKLEREGEERFESRAKEILTTAIHRIGNGLNADVVSTTVVLPSDEIKGKIIGKEDFKQSCNFMSFTAFHFFV